jgi:ribosomal-protein-serine acetyltransferase
MSAPPQTLTDDRVRLRRIDLTDVDTIFDGVSATMEALSAWMPWARPGYSRDDACWFVASAWLGWRGGSAYEFIVEDAADGRFLGLCGLNGVSAAEGSANLGYWVVTGETGRGVCTAATRLVARFGLCQLGLRRVWLFHAVGNIGSQRVAEKVGFVLEGVQRRRLQVGEVVHDTKLYSLVDPAEITQS